MGAPFNLLGKDYSCTEQYYFSSKATAYGDDEAYKGIMKATNPGKMLQLGKRATNLTGIEWTDQQFGVMLRANIAKFQQNEAAREALRATGQTKLGEASKQSTFWSTGLSLYHKDRGDSNLWSGQNKMGEILTQIRNDLPAPQMEH